MYTTVQHLSITLHTTVQDLSITLYTTVQNLSITLYTTVQDLSITLYTTVQDLSITLYTIVQDLSITLYTYVRTVQPLSIQQCNHPFIALEYSAAQRYLHTPPPVVLGVAVVRVGVPAQNVLQSTIGQVAAVG